MWFLSELGACDERGCLMVGRQAFLERGFAGKGCSFHFIKNAVSLELIKLSVLWQTRPRGNEIRPEVRHRSQVNACDFHAEPRGRGENSPDHLIKLLSFSIRQL